MKGHTSSMPLFDGAAERNLPPAIPLNSTVESWDTQRLQTANARLMSLMGDHEWHTNRELLVVCGYRYGQRLKEIKDAGHPWVKEHVSGGTWRYRLLDRGES